MKEKSVWLIIFRKESGVKSIYYEAAVEEALCFGWIDSRGNKRDEVSFYLLMAQRNPKSAWSRINRERVSRLTKAGLMTARGQEMINLAKKTGTWKKLEEIDNLVIPEDLERKFKSNRAASKNFLAFPPSAKKMILNWIREARKPETRKKRIDETVRLAAKNERANQWKGGDR